jgi:hypothetical protein
VNPEIKAQWVAALRSGEYDQGSGVLLRVIEGEKFHCCLGVLCDLAVKAGLEMRVHTYSGDSHIVEFDGYEDFLPIKVVDWAGLESQNPKTRQEVDGMTLNASLTYLNDNTMTFEEIANVIERDF